MYVFSQRVDLIRFHAVFVWFVAILGFSFGSAHANGQDELALEWVGKNFQSAAKLSLAYHSGAPDREAACKSAASQSADGDAGNGQLYCEFLERRWIARSAQPTGDEPARSPAAEHKEQRATSEHLQCREDTLRLFNIHFHECKMLNATSKNGCYRKVEAEVGFFDKAGGQSYCEALPQDWDGTAQIDYGTTTTAWAPVAREQPTSPNPSSSSATGQRVSPQGVVPGQAVASAQPGGLGSPPAAASLPPQSGPTQLGSAPPGPTLSVPNVGTFTPNTPGSTPAAVPVTSSAPAPNAAPTTPTTNAPAPPMTAGNVPLLIQPPGAPAPSTRLPPIPMPPLPASAPLPSIAGTCADVVPNIDWVFTDKGARATFDFHRSKGESVFEAIVQAQAHNPPVQALLRRCRGAAMAYLAQLGAPNDGITLYDGQVGPSACNCITVLPTGTKDIMGFPLYDVKFNCGPDGLKVSVQFTGDIARYSPNPYGFSHVADIGLMGPGQQETVKAPQWTIININAVTLTGANNSFSCRFLPGTMGPGAGLAPPLLVPQPQTAALPPLPPPPPQLRFSIPPLPAGHRHASAAPAPHQVPVPQGKSHNPQSTITGLPNPQGTNRNPSGVSGPPATGTPTPPRVATPPQPAPANPTVPVVRAPTVTVTAPAVPSPTVSNPSPPTRVATNIPTSAAVPPAMLPGGISLSKAAANRLALDLDLDAAYTEEGRLVLSGRAGKGVKVDAPLFLTSMRLACEGADPYFSLDPDDGRLWLEEGRRASDELWELIRVDLKLSGQDWAKTLPQGLNFRAVSARRDYAQKWAAIASKYTNLRTRLVFKPHWLSETRFGEIFYKGDVLLKELSSGVPTIEPKEPSLRALNAGGYVSAKMRSAGEGLLISVDNGSSTGKGFDGNRFWFDLVPRSKSRMRSMLDDDPVIPKPYEPKSDLGRTLKAQLVSRGIQVQPPRDPIRHVSLNGNSVDLSQVYPTMFVIGHDNATGKDVNGDDPFELAVADDVNRRMEQYTAAYKELRELTDVFRLYVAAVAIVKRTKSADACSALATMPLLASEKATSVLPAYHPSEMFYTVASYRISKPNGGYHSWWSSSSSHSGGVSPGGRRLFDEAQAISTPVTQTIETEVPGMLTKENWVGKSGRQYYAFLIAPPSNADAQSVGTTAAVPVPPAKTGGGMLDDVDENAKGVVTVPRR